jgi:hypothetical protein
MSSKPEFKFPSPLKVPPIRYYHEVLVLQHKESG